MYQKSIELYQELGDSQAEVVHQWLTELQTHHHNLHGENQN